MQKGTSKFKQQRNPTTITFSYHKEVSTTAKMMQKNNKNKKIEK